MPPPSSIPPSGSANNLNPLPVSSGNENTSDNVGKVNGHSVVAGRIEAHPNSQKAAELYPGFNEDIAYFDGVVRQDASPQVHEVEDEIDLDDWDSMDAAAQASQPKGSVVDDGEGDFEMVDANSDERTSLIDRSTSVTAPKTGSSSFLVRLSHFWERFLQIVTFSSQSFTIEGTLAQMFFRQIAANVDQPKVKNSDEDWLKYPQSLAGFKKITDTASDNDGKLREVFADAAEGVGHEIEPLFPSGRPCIQDIQQGIGRHDCYLLAAISSILSRPDGASDIMNMMRENVDDSITVRFSDCEVTVTKDKLLDKNGSEFYSTGAPWVRVLEKAYHIRLLNGFGGFAESDRIDRRAGLDGLEPFCHLINKSSLPQELRNLSGDNVAAIRSAIDRGGIVTLGSAPGWQDIGGSIHRVVQGLMPGHQYSIVGRTQLNGEDAFVIYNPYGGPLNNVKNPQDTTSGVVLHGVGRGSALFAVREQDLPSYFTHAAVLAPAA